jgi:hypothetical protein
MKEESSPHEDLPSTEIHCLRGMELTLAIGRARELPCTCAQLDSIVATTSYIIMMHGHNYEQTKCNCWYVTATSVCLVIAQSAVYAAFPKNAGTGLLPSWPFWSWFRSHQTFSSIAKSGRNPLDRQQFIIPKTDTCSAQAPTGTVNWHYQV